MDVGAKQANGVTVATRAPVRIDAVEVRLVRLPLAEPFETSLGAWTHGSLPGADGSGRMTGWGEVVALERPLYSYETVATARHVIVDCFAPALLPGAVASLADLAARLDAFRGHPMARAGLELAFTDLVARLRGESFPQVLGGTRSRVPWGSAWASSRTLDALLERVERHLALGYQRIKLKIKPGWDLDVVRKSGGGIRGSCSRWTPTPRIGSPTRDHLAHSTSSGC